MFNIYYLNYEKAYEIAMLIDNKILDKITKENGWKIDGEGSGNIDSSGLNNIPIVGQHIPKLSFDAAINGNKSSKVIDTVNVISTKSTILKTIYDKAKTKEGLSKLKVGSLLKLKDVKLDNINYDDILAIKTLESGILNKVVVEGLGEVNFTSVMNAFFKDSAYMLLGENGKQENLLLKIPMQAENELESQYNIADIELGQVTIVGIYRGKFIYDKLKDKLTKLSISKMNDNAYEQDVEIETDGDKNRSIEEAHYIDVIAIVQDIEL